MRKKRTFHDLDLYKPQGRRQTPGPRLRPFLSRVYRTVQLANATTLRNKANRLQSGSNTENFRWIVVKKRDISVSNGHSPVLSTRVRSTSLDKSRWCRARGRVSIGASLYQFGSFVDNYYAQNGCNARGGLSGKSAGAPGDTQKYKENGVLGRRAAKKSACGVHRRILGLAPKAPNPDTTPQPSDSGRVAGIGLFTDTLVLNPPGRGANAP